jgi:hypothetical protein
VWVAVYKTGYHATVVAASHCLEKSVSLARVSVGSNAVNERLSRDSNLDCRAISKVDTVENVMLHCLFWVMQC